MTWSAREEAIVRQHATRSLGYARTVLKREGFQRSETAIAVKLKRLGVSTVDPDDDNLTARGLAELLGVDGKTVSTWIAKGWLRARQTMPLAPWTIRPADARRFIVEHPALIDVRKVERFWFIDLLANGPRLRGPEASSFAEAAE